MQKIELGEKEIVSFDGITFQKISYIRLLIDNEDIRAKPRFEDMFVCFPELQRSSQNEGNYLIFTCACGIADDGCWAFVEVNYNQDIVVWKLYHEGELEFKFSKELYIREINKTMEQLKVSTKRLEPENVILPE